MFAALKVRYNMPRAGMTRMTGRGRCLEAQDGRQTGGRREGRRTKSSSAAEVPKEVCLGEGFIEADMSMSVFLASLLNSASKVERKGLRDMGLLPELERSWLAGEARLEGEGRPGEVAWWRKGLLEERLMERPGEG